MVTNTAERCHAYVHVRVHGRVFCSVALTTQANSKPATLTNNTPCNCHHTPCPIYRMLSYLPHKHACMCSCVWLMAEAAMTGLLFLATLHLRTALSFMTPRPAAVVACT